MKKIRLKRADEIDFNKSNGSYHIGFDVAKNKLGRKTYQIYEQYNYYSSTRVHIKNMDGDTIRTITGEIEDFPLSYFKEV